MTNYQALLQILRDDGLLDKAKQVIGHAEAPLFKDKGYHSALQQLSEWVHQLLVRIFPQNYFVNNQGRFIAANPHSFSKRNDKLKIIAGLDKEDREVLDELDNEGMEVSPEDLLGLGRDQSLYHLLDDRRLMTVIREGKFSRLDQHKKGRESTSELEEWVCGGGIYCTFGTEWFSYDMGTGDYNLVVFPRSHLDDNKTVCLSSEISSVSILLNDGELSKTPSKDPLGRILSELGYKNLFGKKPADYSKKDLVKYVTAAMISLVDNVIAPEEVLGNPGAMGIEVVLNDVEKLTPQVIIVTEEPGYFLDEARAQGNCFSNVPYVSQANVDRAVQEHYDQLAGMRSVVKEKQDREDLVNRKLFIVAANKGWIDPSEYAAR